MRWQSLPGVQYEKNAQSFVLEHRSWHAATLPSLVNPQLRGSYTESLRMQERSGTASSFGSAAASGTIRTSAAPCALLPAASAAAAGVVAKKGVVVVTGASLSAACGSASAAMVISALVLVPSPSGTKGVVVVTPVKAEVDVEGLVELGGGTVAVSVSVVLGLGVVAGASSINGSALCGSGTILGFHRHVPWSQHFGSHTRPLAKVTPSLAGTQICPL